MKNRVSDYYDWIILGDHPGALWTALSLLDAGASVLVVSKPVGEENPALPYEESNWCPEFLAPDDLEPVQIITPNRRFKVEFSDASFQKEWKEIFGNTPLLSNTDVSKGLEVVFRGNDHQSQFQEDWKWKLLKCRQQRYFPGGKPALKRHLKNKIQQKSGLVLDHELCQQIFVDSKGFKGIQLQGVSKMVSAQAGLVGMHWELIKPLLSQKSQLNSNPQGWWFTFQFQIPDEMLPIGVTNKMIFVQTNAPAVEIENKGKVWVARTIVPFDESSLNREFQRKIAQRIFKLLESIFPFIEYSASDLNPDIRDPEHSESYDLVQLYPFRDVHHIPSTILTFSGKGLGHQLPFHNFFLAHDESYPRYGEWGVYHAAASAAMDWAKELQKVLPDDIKRVIIS